MTAEVMQILSCSGRVVREAGGGGSGDGVNGGGDGGGEGHEGSNGAINVLQEAVKKLLGISFCLQIVFGDYILPLPSPSTCTRRHRRYLPLHPRLEVPHSFYPTQVCLSP